MSGLAGVGLCPRCDAPAGLDDRFCGTCGAAMPGDPVPVAGPTAREGEPLEGVSQVERRRMGGTAYVSDTTGPPPKPHAAAGSGSRRRRRRRRPTPWFRRPLLVAPLLLVTVLGSLGALAAWRAAEVVSSLRRVSEPPQTVSLPVEEADLTAGPAGDAAAGPVQVDTAPARLAVAEAGLGFDDGGGRVAALGDLGGGAASAAGLGDEPARPMTVLVMGVDARPGEDIDVGVRADVLMLVRLDPAAGACRVLSIPRDTRAELPGYGLSKVNHALALGGIPYQLLVVQQLMGIPVDHYALINFEGFSALVDAIGGIEVDVAETVTVGTMDGDLLTLEPGRRAFDGEEALAYAQYRDFRTDGDIGRIDRQLAVLRGLGAAAAERNVLGDLGEVLPAVESNMRTDLSTEQMASIGRSYGAGCTVDTATAEVLEGRRQRLTDPIFDKKLYFNVVTQATIDDRRAFLLGT